MINRSKSLLAICTALAAGAATAPQAEATAVELYGPTGGRNASPGTVAVFADEGSANHRINVRYEVERDIYVITDSRRFGLVDPTCERIDDRGVRCPGPARVASPPPPGSPTGPADVWIDAGNGDDRLRVDDTVEGWKSISGGGGADFVRVAAEVTGRSELWGGRGRDRIFGGAGDDEIFDGEGADLVRARGGRDSARVDVDVVEAGHSEKNRILMGAGGDVISAETRHADGLLNCGPGHNDSAYLDPTDPKPRSCERIYPELRSRAAGASVGLDGPNPRWGSPGSVYISAYRSRVPHRIDVSYDTKTDSFEIIDVRRFGSIDPACERTTGRSVRCPSPAPVGDADVAISGGDAGDRLRVDATVEGWADLSGGRGRDVLKVAADARGGSAIFGGPGRDRLFGGAGGGDLWGETGGDEIFGGRGHDAVYDGGGKDLVRTGKGADIAYVEVDYSPRSHSFSTENRIYMGPGIDEISARNGHDDGLLSCGGGGDDEALLDFGDPRPRSCEFVRRERGSA